MLSLRSLHDPSAHSFTPYGEHAGHISCVCLTYIICVCLAVCVAGLNYNEERVNPGQVTVKLGKHDRTAVRGTAG